MIDKIAMRFIVLLVAAIAAVVLYVVIHNALGVARKSILVDSLAGAGLLGLVCASALLKRRN